MKVEVSSIVKEKKVRSGKIENRTWSVAFAVDYLNHDTSAKSEASAYIRIINTMAFFFSSPPLLPSRKAQATVVQRVDSGVHRINHCLVGSTIHHLNNWSQPL